MRHFNHCKSSVLLPSLILLLSHFPTPTTVLASPAGMAAATPPQWRYGEAPPPPPSSSSFSAGYGDDASTAPSFALPASTPPQAYLSVTIPATPDATYAPSSSGGSRSSSSMIPSSFSSEATSYQGFTPASSSGIIDGGMRAIGGALALVELGASNSTATTTTTTTAELPSTPAAAAVTAPTTSPSPTGGPGAGEVRDVVGAAMGSPRAERPIFIALAPTAKVEPDLCPQNVCEDYVNKECGVRYGGCWDSCEEDRQYLDPGCEGKSSVKCRGCPQ